MNITRYPLLIACFIAALLAGGGCESFDFIDGSTAPPASVEAGELPAVTIDGEIPPTPASQTIEQVRQAAAALAPAINSATGGGSAPYTAGIVGLLAIVGYVERFVAAWRWKRRNNAAEKIIQQAQPSTALGGELKWIAAKIEQKAKAA